MPRLGQPKDYGINTGQPAKALLYSVSFWLTRCALQIDASNFFIWKSSILSRFLSSVGASGYRPLPAAYGSVILYSLFGGRRLSVVSSIGIFGGSIRLFWSAVSGPFFVIRKVPDGLPICLAFCTFMVLAQIAIMLVAT